MAEYVYVLTSDYLPAGMVKIGRTDDPARRLRDHSTSLPGARYAHCVELPDARTGEATIRRAFWSHALPGAAPRTEWFALVDLDALVRALDALPGACALVDLDALVRPAWTPLVPVALERGARLERERGARQARYNALMGRA